MKLANTLLLLSGLIASTAEGAGFSHSGEVNLSHRVFNDDPLLTDQDSGMWFAEINLKSAVDLSESIRFVSDIQIGIDNDPYFDIEVGKLISDHGAFSTSIGIDSIYWAKTEVARLSNILNPDDLRRGRDVEDRVGRPIASASYLSDVGLFEAYYLPYVVEREFPKADSRLRTQLPITGDAVYEDSREEWTPSFAVRYSGSKGSFDIGAYIYNGVDIDPAPNFVAGELSPFYGKIQQAGIDVQYTSGAFALKAELRRTQNQRDLSMSEGNTFAGAIGVEYTFNAIGGTNADLTLIGEYAYDNRDRLATTPFQDDIVVGARLNSNTINSTEIEIFNIEDLDFGTRIINAEITHKFTDNLRMSFSAQKIYDVAPNDLLFGLRGDENIRVNLTYVF